MDVSGVKEEVAAGGSPSGVSVVIPCRNVGDALPRLLDAVALQSLPPDEVVVVDSSSGEESARAVASWHGPFPVRYRRVEFAFPGHARNLGAEMAAGECLAFLDCRTIPEPYWLKESLSLARSGKDVVVAGLFTGAPITPFQKIVHAASYGNGAIRSLPGTIVPRKLFLESGGFVPGVRAGEDLEWFARLKERGVDCSLPKRPVLRYEGYPLDLGSAVRKWYVYSISTASLEIINDQKLTYCLILVVGLLLFAHRWNALLAHWNEQSLWYIPHVTKIFLGMVLVGYALLRGIIRPRQRKVDNSFLFPWRWVAIFAVGLTLDLAKAPGRIYGAILMLKRRFRTGDRPAVNS
ncbi:hypothetical protein GMSM_20780 [Geomonas sp. Red276]